MINRLIACVAVLFVSLLYAGTMGPTEIQLSAQGPDLGTDAQRESGKTLYPKNCAQCHGDKGDGEGYATPHLFPKPRNFTSGKFKVRTTPNGALPTQQDLVNIIRRGMPYTSMPAWPELSDAQVSDLAYYIKTFYADFANADSVPKPVELPSAPASTEASIELGKKLYVDTGCVKCHGNLGRGDGPSAPTLVDELAQPIRAADLSKSWTFRGGSSREDIFRTMTTGLNGTPMPSFIEALTPEQRWAITDYIASLSGSDGPALQEPRHRQEGAGSDRSGEGRRELRLRSRGTFSDRRTNHGAGALVSSSRDFRDGSGDLRRGGDRVPRSMERHESGQGGNGGSVTSCADREKRRGAGCCCTLRGGRGGCGQSVRRGGECGSSAIRIQRRCGDPDSLAGANRRAEAVLLFGDAQGPVDLWYFDLARTDPLQFTGRGSADIAPNDTGDLNGVASYDQGEWSVIFKRPLRPSAGAAFVPGEFLPVAFSVWDGFSRERGNRRGLSSWYRSTLSRKWPHRPSAQW